MEGWQGERNEAPAYLLMGTDLFLQSAKSVRASDYNSLFLSIGFVVGGIFSKILAASGMSSLGVPFSWRIFTLSDPSEVFWKE